MVRKRSGPSTGNVQRYRCKRNAENPIDSKTTVLQCVSVHKERFVDSPL
jgi:hypothetical protein